MNRGPRGIRSQIAWLLLAGAMFAAGCSTSPVAKYYLLSAVIEPAAPVAAPARGDKTVQIGSVIFPEYLDRPQIVTRAGANRLELADAHRWAEPLADNFARVLQEDLSSLLGAYRVLPRSAARPARGDWHITVEVLRLDAGAGGVAQLMVRWSVTAKDDSAFVPARRSAFEVAPSGPGIEALVAAQSEAVARLAREIAAALTAK